MFGREPAVIAATLAAVIQGVLIFIHNDAAMNLVGWEVWLTPLVTMGAGILTRRKVVPLKTLEDAGMPVKEVKARAEQNKSPAI